jgi:peroxiredoxin Q/BCP
LASIRDDYQEFTALGAEVVAVGPDDLQAFRRYWSENALPFIGLPDPGHRVARLYKQQVRILKWGRLPLVCVLDRAGRIRYAHHGQSMADIPPNSTLLNIISEINRS